MINIVWYRRYGILRTNFGENTTALNRLLDFEASRAKWKPWKPFDFLGVVLIQ